MKDDFTSWSHAIRCPRSRACRRWGVYRDRASSRRSYFYPRILFLTISTWRRLFFIFVLNKTWQELQLKNSFCNNSPSIAFFFLFIKERQIPFIFYIKADTNSFLFFRWSCFLLLFIKKKTCFVILRRNCKIFSKKQRRRLIMILQKPLPCLYDAWCTRTSK